MRLLIIDISGGQSDPLREICTGYEIDMAGVEALQPSHAAVMAADAIIITGGYDAGPVWDQTYFMHGVELVSLTDKPLLGLCLGFELVCYAFGCRLHELAEQVSGAMKIRPTDDGSKVFQGSDPLKIAETSRWDVDEMPRELVVLARSDTGIEAVRHRNRTVFGLQLRPDDFAYPSDGRMVFANIMDILRKSV